MGYDDQTHAELAELLKERGMDVPKTKQERIDALTEADASSPFLHRVQAPYPRPTVPVVAVVVLLVVGVGVTAILFGDSILR